MRLFQKLLSNNRAFDVITKARWAFKLTWSTHKLLLSGIIAATVIQGLMPAALVLTARGLVNAVAVALSGNSDNTNTILLWLALGLGLTVVAALSNAGNRLYTLRLQDELNLRITSDILGHAANLDLAQFEDPRFQDIMERAQQNTARNFSEFLASILTVGMNLVQSISLVGILVVIEPLIALLLLPILLPYLLFQWRVAETGYLLKHSRAVKRRWTRYFVKQMTQHESVAEVRLLGLGPLFSREFRSLLSGFRDQDRKLYTRSFIINVIFALLSATAVYAAFTSVAFRVAAGSLTMGDVAVYGIAAARLRGLLESTVLAFVKALEQTMFISNLIEFFQIESKMTSETGLVLPTSRGEVELKHVTFTYPESKQPILTNISFHINPGETVALVGENGAGKTTLVKLIARLYDPDQGCILFDGHDLRALSLDYLHSQVSFVFQNFGRYEATVADNIAYGDWQRLLNDRNEVEQLARFAEVHNLVESMPQGYDTMLGRIFGNYTLSDGQWQQIALTRACVRSAKLLILDEPTANLDARSEYKLFSHFRELAHRRTTILISHRFSTVSLADRILVMDKGQIVEQGTHQELNGRGGHYASLYRLHRRQMAMPVDGRVERQRQV